MSSKFRFSALGIRGANAVPRPLNSSSSRSELIIFCLIERKTAWNLRLACSYLSETNKKTHLKTSWEHLLPWKFLRSLREKFLLVWMNQWERHVSISLFCSREWEFIFDWSMASNPEFRRIVNYTDLEALLECKFIEIKTKSVTIFCISRSVMPRSIRSTSWVYLLRLLINRFVFVFQFN